MFKEAEHIPADPNEEHLIHGTFLARDTSSIERNESKENWEEYITVVEKCAQDVQLYLDKGGAGTVFAIHGTGFCAKFVQNRGNASPEGVAYDVGNDAAHEAILQQAVQHIVTNGARAPRCLRVLEGSSHSAILMEQLHALNLAKVLTKEEQFPQNFNHDTFFSALEAFIEEMHIAGIQHGDLKARNVMVDKETGKPYVIDFGRSVRLSNDKKTRDKQMAIDWQDYEEIERAVQTLKDDLQK